MEPLHRLSQFASRSPDPWQGLVPADTNAGDETEASMARGLTPITGVSLRGPNELSEPEDRHAIAGAKRMTRHLDAVVIGAGPAGLTAARVIAASSPTRSTSA